MGRSHLCVCCLGVEMTPEQIAEDANLKPVRCGKCKCCRAFRRYARAKRQIVIQAEEILAIKIGKPTKAMLRRMAKQEAAEDLKFTKTPKAIRDYYKSKPKVFTAGGNG